MKASHLISFLGGGLLVIGIMMMAGRSNAESTNHVFELRMYHVNDGKMDALKARFRDHTNAIFQHHNMKALGYWVAEDAPNAKNLFIYLVEHPSRKEADKNWDAFVDDPEWKKARAASEVNGVLVEDKNVERYFMDPTSFSALK
jgi:hypothetical protein